MCSDFESTTKEVILEKIMYNVYNGQLESAERLTH